jgi:hypothetical protein
VIIIDEENSSLWGGHGTGSRERRCGANLRIEPFAIINVPNAGNKRMAEWPKDIS